ncbi:ferritin-like domain-containing protein [Actinoallomurus purpureus]|uniref:ferritin-like domain-containing protein n=1 Tax=Actinoallomurus purpureus TaxID=478114 RepID=UPI00209387DD|nr:ferritin-like domain-containing protein [Actinoallomurus purpureus]MCO6006469.1 ferritin-like domain-containing protein [Actinoallomurus purpureus]
MGAQDTVAALQAALAAEHVAVFGYGVLGGHVSPAQRQSVTQMWNAHRARRDRLRGYVQAAGGRPVAAAAAYRLPFKVTSASGAARLAAALEDGVVAGYAVLAGVSDPAVRRYAALAMQEAAVRAVRWRGSPPTEAFPGLPSSALSPKPER